MTNEMKYAELLKTHKFYVCHNKSITTKFDISSQESSNIKHCII